MKQNCISSWSGGKDSCFALFKAIQQGYRPQALLSMLHEDGELSRSHGIPKFFLEQQAKAMGLPLYTVPASWADYEQRLITTLQQLKTVHTLTDAVFGDIDILSHRAWEEKVCTAASLNALLPLWGQSRLALVTEMLQQGIQSLIVSCLPHLAEQFLGKALTLEVIEALEKAGIDACGENGEYHTLVMNCPLFSAALPVIPGEVQHLGHYSFIQLSVAE